MIKLQNYTPDIYYEESRDFQFIGRLFDLVLNYSKTNADLLYYLPLSDNSDDQFVELMAMTLGFKPRHNYTAKHLRAVCSVFSEILRNKGTVKAIELLCAAILHSEGLEQEMAYKVDLESSKIILYLPQQLTDTTLLTDVLTYILPAGIGCDIIKLLLIDTEATTRVAFDDSIVVLNGGDKPAVNPNEMYLYNLNKMAKLPKYSKTEPTDRNKGIMKTGDAIKALADDKFAETVNTAVYKTDEGE